MRESDKQWTSVCGGHRGRRWRRTLCYCGMQLREFRPATAISSSRWLQFDHRLCPMVILGGERRFPREEMKRTKKKKKLGFVYLIKLRVGIDSFDCPRPPAIRWKVVQPGCIQQKVSTITGDNLSACFVWLFISWDPLFVTIGVIYRSDSPERGIQSYLTVAVIGCVYVESHMRTESELT